MNIKNLTWSAIIEHEEEYDALMNVIWTATWIKFSYREVSARSWK